MSTPQHTPTIPGTSTQRHSLFAKLERDGIPAGAIAFAVVLDDTRDLYVELNEHYRFSMPIRQMVSAVTITPHGSVWQPTAPTRALARSMRKPFAVELTEHGFSVAMSYPDGAVGYIEPEGDRFVNTGTLAYSARHIAQAHADR